MATTTNQAASETRNRAADVGIASSIDASNQLGVAVNTLDRVARIYARQIDLFIEDQRDSLEMLTRTLNPLGTVLNHFERRSEHLGDGLKSLFETLQEGIDRSVNLSRGVWSPIARAANLPVIPDVSRQDVLDRLHADHERLEEVLTRLEAIANKPDPLSPEDKDLLVQGIRYIAEYPDAVHHPLEDRLFEHLLALPLTEQEQRDVRNNAAGHLQMSHATTRLLEDVKALQADSASAGAQLREDLHAFVEIQRRHMAFEENTIFPLAERRLPATALESLGEVDVRADDPLFDLQLERFRGLYDYVSGRV